MNNNAKREGWVHLRKDAAGRPRRRHTLTGLEVMREHDGNWWRLDGRVDYVGTFAKCRQLARFKTMIPRYDELKRAIDGFGEGMRRLSHHLRVALDSLSITCAAIVERLQACLTEEDLERLGIHLSSLDAAVGFADVVVNPSQFTTAEARHVAEWLGLEQNRENVNHSAEVSTGDENVKGTECHLVDSVDFPPVEMKDGDALTVTLTATGKIASVVVEDPGFPPRELVKKPYERPTLRRIPEDEIDERMRAIRSTPEFKALEDACRPAVVGREWYDQAFTPEPFKAMVLGTPVPQGDNECPRCGKPFAQSSDALRLLRGGVCMCDARPRQNEFILPPIVGTARDPDRPKYTHVYHCPICGAPGLVRGLGWSTCATCGPIDHDKLPVREESDTTPTGANSPAIPAGQDEPPTQSDADNLKLTGKPA